MRLVRRLESVWLSRAASVAHQGRVCAGNQYSRAALLECISSPFHPSWLLAKCPTATRTEIVPIRQVQRSCVQLRLRGKSLPRPQNFVVHMQGTDENHVHVCRVSMPRSFRLLKTLFGLCVLLLIMLLAVLLLPNFSKCVSGHPSLVSHSLRRAGRLAGKTSHEPD